MLIRCECGWEKTVKDELAGKKGECPKCGARFVLKPAAAVVAVIPAPVVAVATEPFEEDTDLGDYDDLQPPLPVRRTRRAETPQHVTQVTVTQPSSAAHSLGLSSMVLGILGLLICWIPLVGILGSPLSGLGLLLGGLGLVIAMFRSGSGVGFPIAGTAISGLALGICVVLNMALFAAADATANAARDSIRQQAAERAKTQAAANQNGQSAVAAAPAVTPSPEVTTPTAPAVAEPPAVPPSNYKSEHVSVSIKRVLIRPVLLTTLAGGSSASKEPLLNISLSIENLSDGKKLNFSGWASNQFRANASLSDDLGNTYRMTSFGSASVIGQADSESVYPGKSATDMLIFELPVEKAERLFLKLDRSIIEPGETGDIELSFPTSEIRRPE